MTNIIQEYHAYADKYPQRICKAMLLKIEQDKTYLKKYEYRSEHVNSIIQWIEYYCKVPSGQTKSSNFKLTLTQKYMFACIFGFYHDVEIENYDVNGESLGKVKQTQRLTSEVVFLVGSGAGKSTKLAALVTLLLNTPIINAPEVYIGSTSYAISHQLFDKVDKMIKSQPKLARQFNFRKYKGEIEHITNGGKITAMSSQGDNHEGIIPAVVILDEIHAMKTSKYPDNLKKSTKRDDQLIFEITTQGFVRGGYLDDRLEHCRKVLNGEIKEDSLQVFIYEQDNTDELKEAYKSENYDVLFKSNPNLGQTQSMEVLVKKLIKINQTSSERNTILAKNFNIPQNAQNSLYTAFQCKTKKWDINQIKNRPIFVGLDMANTASPQADLTALTLCYYDIINNERYHIDYSFLPEFYLDNDRGKKNMVVDKSANDGIDYQQLIDRGDVILIKNATRITENFIIDFIEQKIIEYNLFIKKFGLDPNKANNIVNHFNSRAKDPKFCLPYYSEKKIWTTPIIEASQESRELGKVYSNSKLTEIHASQTLEKRDSNHYILLTKEPGSHMDMTIAYMSCYSAIDVWCGVKDKITNRMNSESLKAQVANLEKIKECD